MTDLQKIVGAIQARYSKAYPNGILERWDLNRFYQDLIEIFPDYKITNETDFNYSYCNSFDIRRRQDECKNIYVLTVKVSFIYDAYTMHITAYANHRIGHVVPIPEYGKYSYEVERVRRFFNERGYREIQPDEMGIEVRGVALELAGVATVGKCLFDDFE